MRRHREKSCSHDVHLVIWFQGTFALAALGAAVFLMASALIRDKNLDNAILIALLVQPMSVALQALTNLVTQRNDQPAVPPGTPANPITTTVANPPSDPVNTQPVGEGQTP